MWLRDYEKVTDGAVIRDIGVLAEDVAGFRILHINSTRAGGGVVELLNSLVPLMREAGLDVRWEVLDASPGFFHVTKQLHNGMHGQPVKITPAMRAEYGDTARRNLDLLDEAADLVVLHDQQPLGLSAGRRAGPRWLLWYCHVDPGYAVPEVWDFLAPMAVACDLAVFHLPEYARELPVLQYFMPPGIDPLSDKNREVSADEYQAVLTRLNVDPEGPPVVLQVSRFDRLKDPVGVIEAFKMVRRYRECRLILAGGHADDDPEGAAVVREVLEAAQGVPGVLVLELPPDANLEINVLQRRADVVIQKSLREGFGLTAAEVLWKGKPLVATPTGGLAHQVRDGCTGLAASTPEEAAAAMARLLDNPDLAARLGSAGREHVRRNYILPVYLRNWLRLLAMLKGR